MTLAALLEELKEVDADTEFDISEWCGQLQTIPTCDLGQALIQNSIQRACERPDHQWPFHVAYYPPEGPNAPYYRAYIWPVLKCHTAKADTPTEALLAAYIAAVREEAK
jgi:hypothetical protein